MLSEVRFRYYTDEEIKKLAVVHVQQASTYDRGVPKTDGINDARMGLIDHTVRCPTCFKANCDQHFGFVELVRPVFRLGTINLILMVLRSVCRECGRPKCIIPGLEYTATHIAPMELSPAIMALEPSRERLRLISEACRSKLVCPHCLAPQPTYTKRSRIFIDISYRAKDLASEFVKSRGPEYLVFLKQRFMPDDAAAVLYALHDTTKQFFGLDRPESLMCRLQIVPPPIIRPSNFVGETKVRSENDLTVALQDVVRTNLEFQGLLDEWATTHKFDPKQYELAYDKLQIMVAGIVNHAIKKAAAQDGLLPMVTATSKRKVIDLKCRLNGKKARVRGNLSGKRVDQSGRTVISGDASHDIDELGVPRAMMNKLTFPETVTNFNYATLAASVILGAYQDNGALAVRPPNHSNDHVIWLPILDREARVDLATQLRPGWTVERHLRAGDWVLFNRQPSLWKASMMAFRAYPVDGLTVRLPLPVTRAFNADFDGDEMNIHALQGYEAIAEAQELMSVAQQIVTPQSNSVIIGLVQDSLVGAYRLTSSDSMFGLEDTLDLITAFHYSVPGRDLDDPEEYRAMTLRPPEAFRTFQLPRPAILTKSGPRWTGKQIVSQLIPTSIHICKNPEATLSDMDGPNGLVIRHGDLLAGRLTKTYLGAANTGLVYAIWRLYGPHGTHKFISDAQRLFVKHLAHDGPTQSIVDCFMGTPETTVRILSNYLSRSDAILDLDLPWDVKEAKSSSILQDTLRAVGSTVLQHVRPTSALANCVHSGSKGNVMNIAQIGGCVGQQTVYGRRVPLRQTRLGPRTLVYYSPGDLRAEARGFIANSYLSGLTPAEFFEHQMAGREGIVATAVNTSESGYNQRRMIKGQESQCIGYDGTVRVTTNIIIQAMYGGDDLDGSRLERVKLAWLFQDQQVQQFQKRFTTSTKREFEDAIVFLRRHAVLRANLFKQLDLQFPCALALGPLLLAATEDPHETSFSDLVHDIFHLHKNIHSATKPIWNVSVASFVCQVLEYGPIVLKFRSTIVAMYAKALVAPGEGVGALGASSIGEPSMQMTLNVFHYSGIADKNVTITGLPRFKQLINGVDTYDTANMIAEVRSFEDISQATQIASVYLKDIVKGTIQVGSMGTSLFHGITARGPFSLKFGCEAQSTCKVLHIQGDWASMVRHNMNVQTVAKSLRETFSYDAMVFERPIWTSSFATWTVVLAPWISHAAVPAIVEGLVQQQKVSGLEYVKKAITFQEKTFMFEGPMTRSRHVVETEGSNIIDLARCPFVVPETIRSNNVVEVARTFGISAGLVVLQAELHKVLAFDSSYIDPRHTWLLSDTMGRSGSLAAMTRHNMETLGSSLLQRASFEQSLDVFEEGAAFGRSDPLAGATERIITGQPVCIGTGLMGIHSSVEMEASEQVLVAPLRTRTEDASSHTTIVTPLQRIAVSQKTIDLSMFMTRFSEMDRTSKDDWFELCASQFRATAASKRVIPSIRFTYRSTDGLFKAVSQLCWDWPHWTSKERLPMRMLVTWPYQTWTGVTTVNTEDPLRSKETVLTEMLSQETKDRLVCQIYQEKRPNVQDIPFGVEVASVTYQQASRFTKGPFAFILAREWTGHTNVEAEEKVLKMAPLCTIYLESIGPDEILQNRCSEAQLGNAFFVRLPLL